MTVEIADQVNSITQAYDPAAPGITADDLRALWLQF